MTSGSRQCALTGLQLIPVVDERMLRVAQPKYGPLSAPTRTGEGDRQAWSRYDSPGRTLYVASDEETAYAEVLSPFKRQIGAADPLEADAAALGMKRDEFLEIVAREWEEARFMGVGAVPAQWRHSRQLYQVFADGDGWWIDVEHPDTLAVLEQELEDELASEHISMLTTAVLRGENRRITTTVGEALRRRELDDQSRARGIQYGSKFGGGRGRAIWTPAPEDTWEADLIALSGEPILVTDEHLAHASERFRIRVF